MALPPRLTNATGNTYLMDGAWRSDCTVTPVTNDPGTLSPSKLRERAGAGINPQAPVLECTLYYHYRPT